MVGGSIGVGSGGGDSSEINVQHGAGALDITSADRGQARL